MIRRILLHLPLVLFTLPLAAQKPVPAPNAAEPKPTAAAERLAGNEKRKTTEERSLVTNVGFRNVGPSVMSGRVVDIDVNPLDPTVFYVAYASGGVWFTNNNGTTFTPVFDNQAMVDIGDIAVDWNTDQQRGPKQPTIWVGTGECNSSRSSYAGTGIYKSVDGGKSWQFKGLPETHHIGKILISPDDPNTVYIAAAGHLYSPNKERGVFKTSDGGETWKQALFIDDNTGVIDLFFDPNNSRTLFAISWHRERRAWNFVEGGTASGIYKTTDAGESWNIISGPKSNFPQGEGVGRIGLAIFPGNSAVMYAIVDNQSQKAQKKDDSETIPPLTPADFRKMTKEQFLALDKVRLIEYLKQNRFPEKYSADYVTTEVRAGRLQPVALADYVSDANSDLFNRPIIGAEVYRSNDGGASWTKANSDNLSSLFFTYGYYFGKIWVSPFDANEVFIAGVSLMKSKDGGKTFKGIDGDNQHGDHHAFWADPVRKGHLINGNDGGVNISWDDGDTWIKANTPAVGQFYAIAVDNAKPYNVYGGLQDNGVWCGPSTHSENMEWYGEGRYAWQRLLGGDGMQVQVDSRDNNTVYTGYQFGHYFRVDKNTGEQKEIRPTMELGEQPLRFNWQAPIWLSVHNPDILYMGAQRLYRSMDKGDHFTAISGDLTRGGRTGDVPYGTLSTICESPMKFGLLYTGSDDGLIHVSKDGGATWTRISDKLPQHLRVNRVIASSHVEGRVYAVLSGFQWDHFNAYLFVSDNYGATWTQLGTDLPMEPLNVVREDPVNENLIFIGSDNGLYASLDRGKTFMRMTGGLPPVAVHDLVIQPREHDLVVGTHGRSIYIANIKELELLNDTVLRQDLFVFEKTEIEQQPHFFVSNEQAQLLTYSPISFAWYEKQPGVTTIRFQSEDGKNTFIELRDSSKKGLNFLSTNLVIDSVNAERYRNWAAANDQKPAKKFTKGRLLPEPGVYRIEVETASGAKRSFSVKIKPSEMPFEEEESPEEEPGENGLYIDK